MRAADRWLDTVQQRIQVLAAQPHAGQLRPDLAPELRFLPVGNYLIFYRRSKMVWRLRESFTAQATTARRPSDTPIQNDLSGRMGLCA